jgi:GNAT superfamily N-acetyltransferase
VEKPVEKNQRKKKKPAKDSQAPSQDAEAVVEVTAASVPKTEEACEEAGKGQLAEGSSSAPTDPRVRTLRKKLAQIQAIEQKLEEGCELNEEQRGKLERKEELETELAEVLDPQPPLGTAFTVTYDQLPVFTSFESYDIVRRLALDDCVESAGPRRTVEGYVMLPIKPDGVVEIDHLKEGKPKAAKAKRGKKSADGATEEFKCEPLTLPNSEFSRTATPPWRSPSMRSVGGLRSPSLSLLRSPSSRWQDDPVSVEDIAPTPKAPKEQPPYEFIENIQPFGVSTQASERLKAIMKEVSLLSNDAFEEDALGLVTRKGGWRMTLLARPEGSPDLICIPLDGFSLDAEVAPSLIGFVVYRLRPELESFSIAKIAIVPEHRQQGHGRRLIEWCIKNAKKQSTIAYISLSSLPEAIPFYVRMGFKAIDVKAIDVTLAPDEDLVEGQVYMEYRLKGRSKARRKTGR